MYVSGDTIISLSEDPDAVIIGHKIEIKEAESYDRSIMIIVGLSLLGMVVFPHLPAGREPRTTHRQLTRVYILIITLLLQLT
jgi:hypothetical protein